MKRISVVCIALLALPVLAQVAPARQVKPVTVDFAEEDIVGSQVSPSMEIVDAAKMATHPSFIVVRADFKKEALRSLPR